MKSKLYRDIVLKHMSDYKSNFLGITEKGIYRNSPNNYGHILPKHNTIHDIPIYNLLPTINITNYRLQNSNIQYHQFAHHLNSSQLMCINFFLPMIEDTILLNIIRQAANINISDNAKIKDAEFEKVVPFKDNTNFDFYLNLSTGENIYFEIKYTEQEFGGNCFNNGILKNKYDDKYNNYYAKELKNSVIGLISKDDFFKDYQINRNLAYIRNTNDYVVFILPFDSEDLLNEVTAVKNKYKNISNQVKIVDWTSLCNIALLESKNSILHQHFKLFKEKYII